MGTLETLIAEVAELKRLIVALLARQSGTGSLEGSVRQDEAARIIGVSKRKVEEWVADGRLRSVREDGTVMVPRLAIDEFLNNREKTRAARGDR